MFRNNSRQLHILESISAGDLFVGFLFSGRSTKRMYQVATKRYHERYRNKLAVEKLKTQGYIKYSQRGYLITKEGREALAQVAHKRKLENRTWDGVWRIISYDFPEEERSTRNALRHVLEVAQFKQIQKSVWLCPHDSSLLQELLNKNTTVKRHTVCMLVTKISYENKYKRLFDLEQIH